RLLLEDLEDAAGRRAGVVHQDVETAEIGGGAGHEALGVLRPREIGADREHLAPRLRADLGGGRLEDIPAPRADRHVAALARQRAGDALADPLAPARDEGGLDRQSQLHGAPPAGGRKRSICAGTVPSAAVPRNARDYRTAELSSAGP